MTEVKPQLPQDLRRHRQVVLLAYYALIAYFLLNSIMSFERLTFGILAVWLIQVVPLIPFSTGLHRTHLRTYAWLSFVVLLYFIHAVLLAFDPARRWLGIIEVVICSVLFTWLVIFIRQYRKHFQVGL